MSTYTNLKGFDDVGESLLSDQLEANIKSWFEWGMLGKGAFQNVTIPTSGLYGGNMCQLNLVDEPNYNAGQVWQGFRSNWVWETGVEYPTQPIRVSGVRVNGTFYPSSTTGIYKHHIDYPNGRVVFDSAISTTSTVTCEYSVRTCHFSTSESFWWKEIQFDSFRLDSPQFSQTGSGIWSILAPYRVQLPHVIIEAIPQTNRIPREIGNETFTVQQQVLFHILTENPIDRKKLHDIITYQQEKSIITFDKNLVAAASGFPLDINGSVAANAKMYPDMVKDPPNGYSWKIMRFAKMQSRDQAPVHPLFYATVHGTVEIVIP